LKKKRKRFNFRGEKVNLSYFEIHSLLEGGGSFREKNGRAYLGGGKEGRACLKVASSTTPPTLP